MKSSDVFFTGKLAKFAKISPVLFASAFAFGADYQGDLNTPISETLSGNDDVNITYAGGTLNPPAGDAITVNNNDNFGAGNVYIGYTPGGIGREKPLTGFIEAAEKGISVNIENSGGAAHVYILNEAGISSGSNSVYVSSTAEIHLENRNTASLTSSNADAIYLSSQGTLVKVLNEAGIIAQAGSGINISAVNGSSEVHNFGDINAGSNGISAIGSTGVGVKNSGTISFGGSYGIYAEGGTYDMENTGTIEGMSPGATGVYLGEHGLGTFVNNGIIRANNAIDIQSSNTRLELGEDSELYGSLTLAGYHNTVAVGSVLHDIMGQVTIGGTSTYELILVDSSKYGSMHSMQNMTITGAQLFLDVSNAVVYEGEIYEILTGGVITGTFSNAPMHGDLVYFGENNEYVFQVNYEGTSVFLRAMATVPEPSAFAVLAGLAAIAVASLGRRKN